MSDAEVAYPAADSTCSFEDCQRLAWRSCPEGKCLYHSPSNGNSDETARLVWQTAREMASEEGAGECNFRGWHFPDDPDARFEEGRIVGWFVGCTFERSVSFDGATFSGNAGFERATFSGDAWFWDATFNGNASFLGATFSADARFDRATFSGDAKFEKATFGGNAWFDRATFSGDAGFRRATFSGYAEFERAHFGPGVSISFYRASWERTLQGRNGATTAYRLAKQAAQERGDYGEAGNYHYAEQCAIQNAWRMASGYKPWRKAFWVWCLRFLLGWLVYGYGERPMRPLFIALAVIVLWAGFYCLGDAIVPSDPGLEPAARAAYEPGFWECAYCSIVTFTTLGYGDYQPKEPYRLLAASEALLGAALMAVFIVCLSKKYVR